jgi:hypothetical protein
LYRRAAQTVVQSEGIVFDEKEEQEEDDAWHSDQFPQRCLSLLLPEHALNVLSISAFAC